MERRRRAGVEPLLPGVGNDIGAPVRRGSRGRLPFSGRVEIFCCRQAFSGKYYPSLDALPEPIREMNCLLFILVCASKPSINHCI